MQFEEFSTQSHSTARFFDHSVQNFLSREEDNIDWKTVDSFGEEWNKFHEFSVAEIEKIAKEYFDIVDSTMIGKETRALDVGCGSGRWTYYLSDRVGSIEAIDPSDAVVAAAKLNQNKKNVRISRAGVQNIPFKDNSFDFVMSLGVLHHVPETKKAIKACVDKVAPNGWFLVYLYYNLDNRGVAYRLLLKVVTAIRLVISALPQKLKTWVCDVIALLVYLPAAKLAKYGEKLPAIGKFFKYLPLAQYRDKSFFVMRNDSLDRFGTPLEQRFSKAQIQSMLEEAGLHNIRFSNNVPFWHAVGQKK